MQKKRIFYIILLIIWMSVVFYLSNQTSTESSGLSQKVSSYVPNYNKNEEVIEHVIRKIAHLTEYAIGGILFLLFFSTFELSENKMMLYSEVFGIEYAIIDEIHQLFIPGRSCQFIDVCIDSIGIGLGICFAVLVYKIYEIKIKKFIKIKTFV